MHLMLGIAAALIMQANAPSAAQSALTLKLACEGEATHLVDDSTTGFASDNQGHMVTANTYGSHRERSESALRFELVDGVARIRLPRELVPLLNGGGVDGWWAVTDLKVTDDVIEGRYAMNLLSHPRLRIDRVTGRIEVEGRARNYRGACQSVADRPHAF